MSPQPNFLTGAARLAGVFGWPVSHSLSPRLHGYWLAEYGIDGAYLPLAVAPENFERALRALPALGFRGANVTLPHKGAALKLADRVSAEAKRIGAANTLAIDESGAIEASNSDGFGFIENLRQGAPGWRASAGPTVILGAGGAARALLVALIDAGAPEIRLLNRSRDKAEALAAAFGGPIRVIDWRERAAALAGAGLLVNSTSLGMAGQPPLELALDDLPQSALVNDIVYRPLITPLLAAATARGNPTVDGLGMLLHQARPGFARWFGREPQVSDGLRRFLIQSMGA